MGVNKRIILLGSPLDNSYSRSFFQGAAQACEKAGFDLMYLSGGLQLHYSPDKENLIYANETRSDLLYQLPDPNLADGILLWGAQINHDGDIGEIRRLLQPFAGKPIVSLGLAVEGAHSLIADNYPGSKSLIGHLIDVHGIDSIACLKSDTHFALPEAEDRFRGYLDALSERHIAYRPELVVLGSEIEEEVLLGRKKDFNDFIPWAVIGMRLLLDERGLVPGRDFRALAARDDDAVLHAAAFLKARGYRIPEDVAICGFDDKPEAGCSDPPLSTVRQCFIDQAEKAVELLICLIKGESVALITRLDMTPPVFRESCGCSSVLNRAQGRNTLEEIDAERRFEQSALLASEVRQHRLDDFTRIIISSFEIKYIFSTITRELPALGIPGCYIVLYEDTADPFGTARLVYANYRGCVADDLGPSGIPFPVREILPASRLQSGDSSLSLVICPLQMSKERLGYIAYLRGETNGRFYYSLANQLASVIAGSRLVKSLHEKQSELERLNAEILELSNRDALTGLYNRRAIQRELIKEKQRADRYGGRPNSGFSVLFIDLDNFKYYNDACGHDSGDAALKVFSVFLSTRVRETDIVSRFGGDEFLVLMPDTDSPGSQILAGRILRDLRKERGFIDQVSELLERRISVPDEKLLGCSIGIASYVPETDMDSFLKGADGALYEAKIKGKGRYETAL